MSLTLNERIEIVIRSNLEACTENLPHMKGVVCKTTNSRRKSHVAQVDNSDVGVAMWDDQSPRSLSFQEEKTFRYKV